jgi:hypothetical protein
MSLSSWALVLGIVVDCISRIRIGCLQRIQRKRYVCTTSKTHPGPGVFQSCLVAFLCYGKLLQVTAISTITLMTCFAMGCSGYCSAEPKQQFLLALCTGYFPLVV